MSLTVSVVSTPHLYEPVGLGSDLGLWFQLSSTASSSTNFKYIYNVQSIDSVTSSIIYNLGQYKVPPRPDGTGLFTPHKALRTKMSYDLNPFITNPIGCYNSFVKYNIGYGIEYGPSFSFTGTFNLFGSLGLSVSTSLDIKINDTILLSKDNTTINPQYDTYTNVTSIGTNFIITNIPFGTTSSNETGLITDLQRNTGTSSVFYAFNGTKQYNEVNVDFGLMYGSTGSNTGYKAFTDYIYYTNNQQSSSSVDNKSVYLSNYETLSLLVDKTNFPGTYSLGYLIQYKDGSGYLTYSTPTLGTTYKRMDIPVGPANLTAKGLTMSQVTTYGVLLFDASVGILSGPTIMGYKIDTNCSPYDNKRICWLNRFGGFDYWNFNWKNVKTTNIVRTPFKKILPYNYNIGARGLSTLSTQANDTYTITTDWLQDFDITFLKQLLTSPEVYVVDEVNDLYYPIVITDSQYLTKTKLNDKLYSLQVGYMHSYDINTYNQ